AVLIDDRRRRHCWTSRLCAGVCAQAGNRLNEQVLARKIAVGTITAVARRGRINEFRIDPPGLLVTKAEPVHHARAEVLHHDVRALNQLERRLAAAGAFEVQRHAAQVSITEHEEHADAVHEQVRTRPVTLPGALPRLLDLDDIGTHVGQVLARGGAEQELRERRDPDAGQELELSRFAQSTSCMMCVATATSSSRWFLTSILARVRSLSRSISVIS